MTGDRLDWIIVAFAAVLASSASGGASSWACCRSRGSRWVLSSALAWVLYCSRRDRASPYAPAFGLIGALLAGAILASGLEGVGLRLRRTLVMPGPRRRSTGPLGALLGAALGLGIVWIVAAVAAQTPGQPQLRADIQRSEILRELNRVLPPSGADPERARPPRSAALDHRSLARRRAALARSRAAPGVRAAARSVVRVLGTACGLAIEGSGWVAAPDVVVTNAHVVAGEQDTTVEIGGRSRGAAAPSRSPYDPKTTSRSCACPDSACPALRLARLPPSGASGAILGYPENGPFDAQPARIGRTQDVLTQDAYGHGPVSRLLTPLRGLVRPGNSGGPLVDRSGRVLTTVFAAPSAAGRHGGYGVANATVARAGCIARRTGHGGEVGDGALHGGLRWSPARRAGDRPSPPPIQPLR